MPYKIMVITETNHVQYGKGQQATVESTKGQKYRLQLPGKYLAQLDASDISTFMKDIDSGNNPYLVYRETMPDKSYRIDIVEKSEQNDDLFRVGKEVPELDNSVEVVDQISSSNPKVANPDQLEDKDEKTQLPIKLEAENGDTA